MKKLKSLIYNIFLSRLRSKNKHNDFLVVLRRWSLNGLAGKIGSNCNIQQGVSFRTPENLIIGDNSGIGRNSYIFSDSNITIGENVMIGPEVMIFTANHDYKTEKPMNQSGYKYKPVIIKDDVWIGARAIILPGTVIESGAVIAAGSVVTGGLIKSNEIYAGNPARKIKGRHD